MKAYRHLVKYALAGKNTVSVFDGEEWACKKCDGFNQIIADIESVEMSQVIIRDGAGEKLGWALIVMDTGEDEHVADHSDNEYMNTWYSIYNQ